ncbi:MAG: DUF2065 domain-containing protein [Betaproteobacteria bacterium]|nr:DUF2065 domain-containing protein [Betaproteobacteria bacterium]
MSTVLLMALGLLFVLEGLFPFLAPERWRQTFLQLAQLSAGQIRFFGLVAILFGILLLALHHFTADI